MDTPRPPLSPDVDLRDELVHQTRYILDHPPPWPALWLLVEFMRSVSALGAWSEDFQKQEHTR